MTADRVRLVEVAGGTVHVYRGLVLAGWASPRILFRPDGAWFGKRRGQDAVPCATRHEAVAHVLGGCPVEGCGECGAAQ